MNPVISNDQILKVFRGSREYLFNRLRKRLDGRMFDDVMIDEIIDNIFTFILTSRAYKVGFNNEDHLLNTLKAAARTAERVEYFRRRRQMLSEVSLTTERLLQEMQKARSIIDEARKFSDGFFNVDKYKCWMTGN